MRPIDADAIDKRYVPIAPVFEGDAVHYEWMAFVEDINKLPTIDLRKVTQDYASDTTIDVIPVAWIEERISNAKEAGQTLIAQMWQELIDGYNRESK